MDNAVDARFSRLFFIICCGALWPLSTVWAAIPDRADALAAAPGADASAPAGAGADPGALAEVIVTARKRAENQRDVPASIVTLQGEQLAALNITQIVDLTSVEPTLVASYATLQPFVAIRGFGSGNNQSFDQAVGKFVDNVSFGRDQDARLPLFDIAQVEVLKGPQVLLYGNSTTAGALNITTRKPGDEFAADGTASYEFYGQESKVQGGVTLPIKDLLSVRVSGMYERLNEGWNYNVATAEHVPTSENKAGRIILRTAAIPDLEVLFKLEYDKLTDKGNVGSPVAQPTSGPFQFPDVGRVGIIYANNEVAPFFQGSFNTLRNTVYQLDMNYAVLSGMLTSTSAYRVLDFAGDTAGAQQVPVFDGFISYTDRQVSQELRFSRSFGPVDATLGAYYQRNDRLNLTTANFNFAPLPFPALAVAYVSPQRITSYSGFADFTWHMTDRLSLEAGARYSAISEDADQSAQPGDIVPNKGLSDNLYNSISPNPAFDPLYTILFGAPPHFYDGLHLHETHIQPQAVAQYRLTDTNQVYAKFVKGDKQGGFDTVDQGITGPSGAHFLPEQAKSFEVGFKGEALDRRLDYAVSAFHTTFTNLQTNAYVGTATVAVVTNVGKARTQGLEAELKYAPVRGLLLSATTSYTDAKYIDFPGGSCTRAQAVAGCVTQDLSNTPTPFASKFAGTLGGEYEHALGSYRLSGGVLITGRTSYNSSFNNEPLLEQGGYAQLDAHVDLLADRWKASLFGRNLTDRRYQTFGSVAPGTINGLLDFTSRGRQAGVQVGFNF
jgi:iron complex outermembrane recepter protein